MHFLIRQVLMATIALAGLVPGLAAAQTPVAATPTSGPGIQVAVLADTAALTVSNNQGTPAPVADPVEHRLVRITMEPEFGFHTGVVMQSALIYVENGSITVSSAETASSVSVGSGQRIVAGDGDTVICEEDVCDVEPGQEIVLGPGNSFAIMQDSLSVKTVGNEIAVFEMSAVFMASNHELCWICPTM